MRERRRAGPAEPARPRLGATPLNGGRCRFEVWAPLARRVEVHLLGADRFVELASDECGTFSTTIDEVSPGTVYRYRLDSGGEYADPASVSQPDGVHGPSQVVDTTGYFWNDGAWHGVPLADLVLYELHVGTFTGDGTFSGAAGHLAELRALGVTAVEPMPIAQFPGGRNWGYDGVFPFAAQDTYGGPAGFAAFVDASHETGLAVVLDVVYNHLGPEGSVQRAFGPYFTDRYRTPWGDAINYDGPGSDQVRRYFIENALRWFEEFHVDGLRLDAVHGIYDFTAHTFLEELGEAVDVLEARLGRQLLVIAESALNDPRVVRARAEGGLGLDAQWSDDFHHAVHAYLTGERHAYYVDYGSLADVGKAYRDGFVLDGRYSRFRDRRFGTSSRLVPAEQLVVFGQNHDQVGNRPGSTRAAAELSLEELKLLAAAVLLSPYVPLLFMGEEYGEMAPFPYFVSHTDADLVEAVRRGRRLELGDAAGAESLDPQDEATFLMAKLDRDVLADEGAPGERARRLHGFYCRLLRLRAEQQALGRPSKDGLRVSEQDGAIVLLRHPPVDPPGTGSAIAGSVFGIGTSPDDMVPSAAEGTGAGTTISSGSVPALIVFTFAPEPTQITVPPSGRRWSLALDSASAEWGGPGSALPASCAENDTLTPSPRSAAVYLAIGEAA